MKTCKRLMRIGFFIIFLIFLFPNQSLGWGNTWLGQYLERIVTSARGRIGSLKYDTAFAINNAEYNSDIYFGAAPAPTPDYTFTIEPQLSLYIPLRKGIVLSISEVPEYLFYQKTKNYRALNNAIRSQIHFAFDRLYFQAGGGFNDMKGVLNTELNFNIRNKLTEISGQAFWQISEKSAAVIQYKLAKYQYEDPPDKMYRYADILNRKESLVTFMACLNQILGGRIFVSTEYGSLVFDDAVSSSKNSRSYAVYGGIEFLRAQAAEEAKKGITGRINIGYQRFHILDPRRGNYEGLAGNANIAVNILKFTELRGTFSRVILPSIYSDLSYYVQTIFGAEITRALAKEINVFYNLSYGRNDYGAFAMNASEGARLDTYINHNLGIRFKLGREIALGLVTRFGRRITQHADQTNLDRNNFAVGFNLTFGNASRVASELMNPFYR